MLKSYFDLNFEVIKKADSRRYANGNDKRLTILGQNALFSNFKLSTSSGKHLEDFSHAYIVSLLYKLINSGEDTDGLSVGFVRRDRRRRQQELTNYQKT